MSIENISKKDVSKIVVVHKNSFKDFFLTELGDVFLSLYYECLCDNEEALLIGLVDKDEVSGFCAVAYRSKGFNSRLIKRNIFDFAGIGIGILFTKPFSLVRLFKNLSKVNPDVSDNGEYAEILSIGVSQNMQGKGIGRELLMDIEEKLKLKECDTISLTTDFYNNEKTIKFYEGLGYKIYYDFIAYPNRKMYRMIKKIN